jgi:hypothetical protein
VLGMLRPMSHYGRFKSHRRVQFSDSQFELVLFKPSARQAELSLLVVASTAT